MNGSFAWLWLAGATLGATPVLAQEEGIDDLEALLDSHVVSGASRAAERSDDAPATVITVTADDLKRYGIRSLNEAINFLSLGMVSQDPLHSVEVGSRGVLFSSDYGNHVLLLVDGHLMNEAWDGTAYFEQGLGVPLELIDRIELIVGPGSVLYGSYAMLGVVSVVTKRPKDLNGVAVNVEGSLLPALDENANPQMRASGLGWTGRLNLLAGKEFSVAGAPLGLVLAAEYYQQRGSDLDWKAQSGFGDGDGSQTWPFNFGSRTAPGTWGGRTYDSWATRVPTGMLKAQWGDVEVWAKASLYKRWTPYLGSFGVQPSDFDSPATYEQDLWFDLEVKWQRALTNRVTALARAYFDRYEYFSSNRSSSWDTYGVSEIEPGDPRTFVFDVQGSGASRWGGVELQSTVDWLGDGRFSLLAGADLRESYFASANLFRDLEGREIARTNAYHQMEWLAAPYLQQRARLGRSLLVNVGLRLDLQSGFAARPSPRGAAVWATPWGGKLKATLSSAFRTPSGYERFSRFEGTQIQNPALKPESVVTGELGYEHRLGRHRILVGGFYSHYSDMVRLTQAPADLAPNGESWYENIGTLDNFGGNLRAEGILGRFRYGVSFTAATTRADDGSGLVVAPTWFGNARVSYELSELGETKPTLSLASFFAAARYVDVAFAHGTDSQGSDVAWAGSIRAPPQVDLRATLLAPIASVKGLGTQVVLGGSLTRWSPYAAGPRQAPDGAGQSPALAPNNNRLFFMATVSYSNDFWAK